MVQCTADVLKSPALLQELCDPAKLPPGLPLLRLQRDISRCCQADHCYSPYMDVYRQATGATPSR
jgi:hypothetical protein